VKQSLAEVRCEKDGPIWTITIDNQARRNAFSGEMVYQLEGFLEEADASPSVRAVIITGAGDVAFSSGHDLREMLSHPEHGFGKQANAGFIRPHTMRVPVIAAVNGFAYAAGFILAMSCDLRIASENAKFATPGAKVGLLPIGGQISRLFHLIPQAKLLELLYTGNPLGARDALSLGFVNEVVPSGEVIAAAKRMAGKVAANSPAVITQIKQGVEIAQRHGIGAGEFFEWATAELLRASPDMNEGIAAFVEKRAPRFADRV
jgi:enoyl-CoA hydratase/carnithine racemase